MPLTEFTCKLKNDITLLIEGPRGAIPFRQISSFLADALDHFKHERDVLKTDLYKAGPYVITWQEDGVTLVTLTFTHSGDSSGSHLTAAQWSEAMADAYSTADTVSQMFRQKSAYRSSAKGQTGWIADVVKLFGKPDGELRAYGMAMAHRNGT